jgi:hypothetical protein
VTIGTSFPIYEGGEEGLLPSVNILRFHHSTLASAIQTTSTKVSSDLIPAAPLWLRDRIAFALSDDDWAQVLDVKLILQVSVHLPLTTVILNNLHQDSNRVLHHFSANKHPSLYCALPALEDLQSIWEAKLEDSHFKIYHNAIKDGLAKLRKYYCRFDEKVAYILALGMDRSILLYLK